jgi:hypothetical protein
MTMRAKPAQNPMKSGYRTTTLVTEDGKEDREESTFLDDLESLLGELLASKGFGNGGDGQALAAVLVLVVAIVVAVASHGERKVGWGGGGGEGARRRARARSGRRERKTKREREREREGDVRVRAARGPGLFFWQVGRGVRGSGFPLG